MRPLFLSLAVVALLADLAVAAPGDPRAMKGTLEWPTTLSAESIAVVRGDDGALYYVDVTTAERRGTPISGQISIIAIEGTKPHELTAVLIGTGESALAALGSKPANGVEVAASPRTESVDDLWRVQGKVRAVSVADIIVETAQGQNIRVDASRLSRWTTQTLRPGDEVKLYGTPQADNQLIANGFIQLMPAVPSSR